MSRGRMFAAMVLGAALAAAAVIVLTGLAPLGGEDAPQGEEIATEPASSGFDVWVLVDEDWFDLDDGAFCMEPGDAAGCTDLSSTTHAWPWLHFQGHPEEGQRVDLVYVKATGEGLSPDERVVVAELPYELLTETGAVGIELLPHGPTSYRKLSARGTCQVPCMDAGGFAIDAGAMDHWSNRALHNEIAPPDDGHVPADVYFPTHPTFGGPQPGFVKGVLVERHGCLFMGPGPKLGLLLWPPGHRAIVIEGRNSVLDPMGEVAAVVGEPISVSGSDMVESEEGGPTPSDWKHFESRAGDPVPTRCRDEIPYWITELGQPSPDAG